MYVYVLYNTKQHKKSPEQQQQQRLNAASWQQLIVHSEPSVTNKCSYLRSKWMHPEAVGIADGGTGPLPRSQMPLSEKI